MKFRIKYVVKVFDRLKKIWKLESKIVEITAFNAKEALRTVNRSGNIISAEIKNA